MAEIFVNYRTSDTPFGAALIDRVLSQHFGLDAVFFASRSIPLGDDFAKTILPAVRGAKVLLALIGPDWLKATDSDGRPLLNRPDDWVRREIAEAFHHGVRVIPVLLDDAELPTEHDLPVEIRRLARNQYIHIRHRHVKHDVQRLIDELAKFLPNHANDENARIMPMEQEGQSTAGARRPFATNHRAPKSNRKDDRARSGRRINSSNRKQRRARSATIGAAVTVLGGVVTALVYGSPAIPGTDAGTTSRNNVSRTANVHPSSKPTTNSPTEPNQPDWIIIV